MSAIQPAVTWRLSRRQVPMATRRVPVEWGGSKQTGGRWRRDRVWTVKNIIVISGNKLDQRRTRDQLTEPFAFLFLTLNPSRLVYSRCILQGENNDLQHSVEDRFRFLSLFYGPRKTSCFGSDDGSELLTVPGKNVNTYKNILCYRGFEII